MKKTLLTIFTAVLSVSFASAQCTPNVQYADSTGNFFPDSAIFLAEDYAVAGVAYEATLNIKTLSDTLVTDPVTTTAFIDAFKIHAISGAPAGFGFTGGGTTYEATDPNTDYNDVADSTWWNVYETLNDPTTLSPVQGCIQITASAAAVTAAAPAVGFTDYPIVVLVDARIVLTQPNVSFAIANGTWMSESLLVDPLPVNQYVLRVYADDPAGVAELLNTNSFEVAQNYPNPADETTIISFTTPNSDRIELNVYNMLGGLVYSETVNSQKGINKIELETASMTSGLYVYTVTNGVKTYTKRMTIQ